MPFPIVNNAMELIMDKRFSYRGYKVTRQFAAAPVQSNGSYNLISVQDEAIFRYANPAVKSSDRSEQHRSALHRQHDLAARVWRAT